LLFNFATLPKCYVVILFQIFTNCYSFTIAIYFDQIKNKQFISNELTKFEQIKQTFNSLKQKQLETGNLNFFAQNELRRYKNNSNI